MTAKKKTSAQAHRGVRHFEFIMPQPFADAIQTINQYHEQYADKQLRLISTPTSADLHQLTGALGDFIVLTGYLKPLPDNSTLISGKISANQAYTSLDAGNLNLSEITWFARVLSVMGFGTLIAATTWTLLLILLMGWAKTSTLLVLEFFVCWLPYGIVFLPVLGGRWLSWRAAQRERDDLLLALQIRLGNSHDTEKDSRSLNPA